MSNARLGALNLKGKNAPFYLKFFLAKIAFSNFGQLDQSNRMLSWSIHLCLNAGSRKASHENIKSPCIALTQ